MWTDRLTGKQCRQLPPVIEPGRYQYGVNGPAFNGHTLNLSGVLVSDGDERCQLGSEVHSFVLPQQAQTAATELLYKAIETIDADVQQQPALMSPLMPAAIIDAQSHLQPFEECLLDVVQQGHLHQISQRPRLDLHYEDEVTDVARARRLAKGALVHLASHSECWQRQTLSGVIPKKVLARFSEDDYGIYENRVYARLLDKIERHLQKRLSALKSLQATLDQALKLYRSDDVDYRLSHEVCRLWGMTFDQAGTSKASELLSETLEVLQRLYRSISALQQSGLYLQVSRQAQITGALHLTNILSHDPHYRHLAILWDLLAKATVANRRTPEERFRQNQYLADAYARYAGLVLRHALHPYLHGQDEGTWAGRRIRLQQRGLEWELVSAASGEQVVDEVLLTVVPWLTDVSLIEELQQPPVDRFIAWPAIGEEPQQSAYQGNWITLSPSDMYCVERFGHLVDQALYRMVLLSYAQPITKIPVQALTLADPIKGVHVDHQRHVLEVREFVPESAIATLMSALIAANSKRQAGALEQHNQGIYALEKCPVCKAKVALFFQAPAGFRANCEECGTERYLRQQDGRLVFEQTVYGCTGFSTLGRRAFSIEL
ncbi:hypothetical protein N5C55_03810 [Pseudomonas otitidis]|uniref:hypothetical protein n=1 Tax=Metapseudomonas otitidis TaxID=319939 RepID=UPI00244B74FD|nr:hypothetical protein [Pseudomonas otitidis]MDH1107154.1 hypothetical protein [Pseudomonas otitidis]MDH1157289.1 hypothetical protein [Pseudomonas otitidis]MDH1165276.1 hypothetical protein [Pseudomonas otitidis]